MQKQKPVKVDMSNISFAYKIHQNFAI